MFENPRTGRQARNVTKNVPKIPDLKSSSEQIFSEIDVGCPCAVLSDSNGLCLSNLLAKTLSFAMSAFEKNKCVALRRTRF